MELPALFDEKNVYLLVEWKDVEGIITHIHIPSLNPVSTDAFAKMLESASKSFAKCVQESMEAHPLLEQIEADITEKYNQLMRENPNNLERI